MTRYPDIGRVRLGWGLLQNVETGRPSELGEYSPLQFLFASRGLATRGLEVYAH